MARIYIKNNYFFVDYEGRQYENPAKDVRVHRLSSTSDDFSFENLNGWERTMSINISEIEDIDGNPYTLESWVDFYTQNTGKSSGGGNGEGLQKGAVDTFADLANVQDPKENDLWYVRTATGYLLLGTLKRKGFYRYNGTGWETTNLPSELITEKEHGAPFHDSSKSYYAGNLIWHNGTLQRCKADITPKVFDANDWDEIQSSGGGGSTPFLTTPTELSETDTHYYTIGDRTDNTWQINKQSKADTNLVEKATETNNPTITSRALAEQNYQSLTYAA